MGKLGARVTALSLSLGPEPEDSRSGALVSAESGWLGETDPLELPVSGLSVPRGFYRLQSRRHLGILSHLDGSCRLFSPATA